MPELPEVESFRRRFLQGTDSSPPLVGKQIQGATLLWPGSLATPSPETFAVQVAGQIIEDIRRRGKYLLFHLSRHVLAIHLRMSGDLWVEGESKPPQKHHRLLLHLEGGMRLVFNDTRKFGRCWLVQDPTPLLNHLGPEPLDESFTPQRLYASLSVRRRQLKPLLMDQRFLAGLGNIYTDEALHIARLHPQTAANTVTRKQAEALWHAIREVLSEGIRRNGASIDWVYRGGDFQNYFKVYQRTHQPCHTCQTPIQRIVVGQRGTHFCPRCQPRSL